MLPVGVQHDIDADAHERPQDGDQIVDDLGRIDVDRQQYLASGECEQLSSDGAGAFGARHHLIEVYEDGVALGQVSASQLCVSQDRREHVVEVMDDPAGEEADCLQPLGLRHQAIARIDGHD